MRFGLVECRGGAILPALAQRTTTHTTANDSACKTSELAVHDRCISLRAAVLADTPVKSKREPTRQEACHRNSAMFRTALTCTLDLPAEYTTDYLVVN